MKVLKTCPVCETSFEAVRVSQRCCLNKCTVTERRRREAGVPISNREFAARKAAKVRTDGLRRCPRCTRDLPADEEHFYKALQGLGSWCRDCSNEVTKDRQRRLRLRVLKHYGGEDPACACCKEKRLEFLSIDHIEGGGNEQRRRDNVRSGASFNYWLVRNHFPTGFRLRCHNCNMARGFYGVCPHEKETAACVSTTT